MLETALCLLVAHVFADFVLQFHWIIKNKREARAFLVHTLIVAATAAFTLGAIGSWSLEAGYAIALITFSHALIDAGKLWQSEKAWVENQPRGPLILFLADQFFHFLFIAVAAFYFPAAWESGIWASNTPEFQTLLLTVFCTLTGFILATRTGGFVIRLFMQGFENAQPAASSAESSDPLAQDNEDEGLPYGGAWIGLLERALIFLLILSQQFEAIGFLIAAKSILRFQYASKERSHSETVIIGTLASFTWAIVVSWATVKAIELVQ